LPVNSDVPTEAPPGEERRGTLFINDLTKLDSAIFDPSWGIVGQSWHVDVSLSGTLDECGFVYDFSTLKGLIKQTLKTSIDHALILPVGSQFVHYSELGSSEHWIVHAKTRMNAVDAKWEYTCPKGAVYPIRCVAITPSVIEQEISKLIRHRMPPSVSEVKVKLRPEVVDPTIATFRYTHGISGHQGLCQRLFHGHRSRLEIYVNEERRPDQEQYVARELFGAYVHVATPQQIKNGNAWEIGARGPSTNLITLFVNGTLGAYEAVLPQDHVWLDNWQSLLHVAQKRSVKRGWSATRESIRAGSGLLDTTSRRRAKMRGRLGLYPRLQMTPDGTEPQR
jgi:6-pyruvoyl-tetrahydropterin synthase